MVNKLKVSDEDFLTCSTLSSTISITNFSITLHVTTSFPCCLLIIFSLLYFFVAALSFCCQFFFFFFAPLNFFLGALFCCHHFSCFLLPLYFIIAALFFCLLKKRSGEEWKNRQQKNMEQLRMSLVRMSFRTSPGVLHSFKREFNL